MITLSVTPLRRLFGWSQLVRYRRTLGLFVFFYVCMHFSIYILDQSDIDAIGRDIVKRPYITLGFSAFLLLIPLAVTSTDRMVRRLGRRWKQLHRMVYVCAVLAVLHFLWLVKADTREPLIFGTVLLALLILRHRWLDGWYARNRG